MKCQEYGKWTKVVFIPKIENGGPAFNFIWAPGFINVNTAQDLFSYDVCLCFHYYNGMQELISR